MEDINDLIKEIENIEINIKNNENKTNILIIKVNENKEVEDIIKNKQTICNDIGISKELINKILKKIKEEYCSNEYNIKYLLDFKINKNIDEINKIDKLDLKNNDVNNYKLNILKNIENIENIYYNNED